MKIDIKQLKKLREETQAGVADCRQALEDADGNFEQAKKLLLKRGLEKATKKKDRAAADGLVHSYIHTTGKVGVLVEVKCETDFVARTDEFKSLAHEIALQIASMNPENEKVLLESSYIRDSSLTISALIDQAIAKLGENIQVGRFTRYELGVE